MSGCAPSCTGRVCGNDGCGGTCLPGCSENSICNAFGNCQGLGHWEATSNLSHERKWAGIVILDNGEVLVAGGMGICSSYCEHLRSSEIYNPNSGIWRMTGELNETRMTSAVKLNDGRILMAGGFYDGIGISTVEIYNPSVGQWSIVAPLPQGREWHSTTVLKDGRVLVAGGSLNNNTCLKTAFIYNPSTNIWSTAAPMNESRCEHRALLLDNGNVLVSGSGSAGVENNTVEMYDPVNNIWQPTASMNFARWKHALVEINDSQMFVTGGWDDPETCEIFDPLVSHWKIIDSLAQGRADMVVQYLSDGVIIVSHGTSQGIFFNSSELYSPGSNKWLAGPTATSIRYGQMAVRLNDGRILVAGGGSDGVHTLKTSELYYPDGWPCSILDFCSNHGVCNQAERSCSCSPGYTGIRCDQCEDGYTGWPYCILAADGRYGH